MVGALVALVSTLFTVAPAQANASGPVTLLPTAGTTYNTIIGSPISLVSTQDPASRTTTLASQSANATYYVIDNPAEAEIKISFATAPQEAGVTTFSYLSYDANGNATSRTSSEAVTGVSFAGSVTSPNYVITTSRSKIAVAAATSVSGAITLNTIGLDATGTSTVTLTVQTLVDTATGTDATRGKFNESAFDRRSAAQNVIIYAPGAVPATTTIDSITPGTTNAKISVVYGNNVNPFFVHGATRVALTRDGAAVNWSSSATWSTVTISSTATTSGLGLSANTLTAGVNNVGAAGNPALGANATAGIYSAQAYYNGVTVGAASRVWDSSAGPSTLVASVSPLFVDTLDAAFSSSNTDKEIAVRSGTKTLTLGAQIWSASATLAAANVEVWLRVAGSLDASTSVTVTGAAGTLVKDGSALNAYARTDTNGKVSFTITSTTGKKADALSVVLRAKKSDGTWADMVSPSGDVDIVWEDAAFSTLKAKPATYVSGANPTVTFTVADQWGKGLNAIDGKALTVYSVASFGGVERPLSYSATVPVSATGEAKFTFANFAPAGGLAQLRASLFTGGIGTSTAIGSAVTVNVYNTAATDRVTVATSFTTPITYKDYVTGDTTDAAVAQKVSDAGLVPATDGVTISGNVLNATGVGQPGVAVTIAAKGVLFHDDGVYTLDSVTTNANEFGAFSVQAIAQTVHARGTTVSITADGKTATTQLITHLPASIGDDNLKFSWTLPAQVVKNTTYAVTLSLTDKWGNPVAATTTSNGAVSVTGVGSVEINSSASAIHRNFDRNGQVVVFLRSVKDIAGPGSITATLTSVFNYPGANGTAVASGTIDAFNTTNLRSTAWDESAWSNTLTSNIEVLDRATATGGTVNVGSFNGKLVVYAANLNGARISWKVGGNWGSAVADSNFARFDRPTPRRGVTVSVDIYVNGVKTLTKSVVTR